ncbi:hypothetical protein ACE1OE_05880 [Vibrio sp. E150_011]
MLRNTEILNSLHLHSHRELTVKGRPISYQRRMETNVLNKVSQLASKHQWVLLTAECPRPTLAQISHYQGLGNHMVQIKPSIHLNQTQVIEKAIRSGNACAIIANGDFSPSCQRELQQLAKQHHCEVIFLPSAPYLH